MYATGIDISYATFFLRNFKALILNTVQLCQYGLNFLFISNVLIKKIILIKIDKNFRRPHNIESYVRGKHEGSHTLGFGKYSIY